MSALTERIGGSPVAGFTVGILTLETTHPLLPGNVQNAMSFAFPVIYETVKGISFPQLMAGDSACDAAIRIAIERLERMGVSIIVGACGSFANWQTRIREYSKVPVFASIMTQVPFILSGLPAAQKLGVVFADAAAFTPRVQQECSISAADVQRMVIVGANDLPGLFPFFSCGTDTDGRNLEKPLIDLLLKTRDQHPDIGVWLLQCSDLPPYAAALQRATGIPVFDMTTLATHLYIVAARRPYFEQIRHNAPFV
jgi:Asp/Glu/hydantoin racemase